MLLLAASTASLAQTTPEGRPTYLIVVFTAFCYMNLPSWIAAVAESPLRQGALALVAAVTAILVVCLYVGEKRWRALGLDIDGREPVDESLGGVQ